MSSLDVSDVELTGLLSDATLSALQLHEQPFGPIGPDSPTFSDEITAEQLADVKQALITGDDLLLILGEPGAGKSVLLSQLSADSGLRIQCFAVKGSSRFSTLNLFAGMLEAFKRPPPEKLKDILDDLIPCLQTMIARNTLSAIVLDDAHEINETELTQLLSGMLYVNSQDETLMRVALAAPGAFEDRIPDLLPEGADLPYSSLTIEGMDPQRATDYLSFRLHEAGFEGEFPLSTSEMATLTEQSAGLPRLLHRAAASTLNAEYGPIEESLPVELLTETGDSFLHTRMGKLALGVLATVLIIGGLMMFLPGTGEDDRSRYDVAEQAAQEAPKLLIVESDEPEPSAAQSDADNAVSESAAVETESVAEQAEQPAAAVAVNDSPNSETESTDNSTDAQAAAAASESDEGGTSSQVAEAALEQPEEGAVEPVVAETTQDDVADGVADDSNADSEATADSTEAATEPATDETTDDTTDETASDPDPGALAGLESPSWILVQSPEKFTVQMSASRDRPSVENFLLRNADALLPPNSIYTFERNGDTWYALLNGLYDTIADARSAVERMPAGAQTNQPWIRNVGRVQAVLKAQ